jgi:hypothetical protein
MAAQAGFLDGPRVLANMAVDRWFPSRFAMLSDRFVSQNGIVLMGLAALAVILVTNGAVALLVVLYSINVFITFSLSQFGMMRHWWKERGVAPHWKKKLSVNTVGFLCTGFILVMLTATKFKEGGWATVLVTMLFVAGAFLTRKHYQKIARELARLDELVPAVESDTQLQAEREVRECDSKAKTAVLFVNGFNGLGIHTFLTVVRMFPGMFRNFVFVQVGVVDAGNFKGSGEIENLRKHIGSEAKRYANYARAQGFYAETATDLGPDVVETANELSKGIVERFTDAVFFGGQLVFEKESRAMRLLHNFTVFTLQRRFFRMGLPFVVLPIRV